MTHINFDELEDKDYTMDVDKNSIVNRSPLLTKDSRNRVHVFYGIKMLEKENKTKHIRIGFISKPKIITSR